MKSAFFPLLYYKRVAVIGWKRHIKGKKSVSLRSKVGEGE